MTIDHVIEPAPVGTDGVVLRVQCTDEQARALTDILGHRYPGRHHPFYPLVGPDFSHACRVRDTVEGLRRKWPEIAMQLMLGPASKRRRSQTLEGLLGGGSNAPVSHSRLAEHPGDRCALDQRSSRAKRDAAPPGRGAELRSDEIMPSPDEVFELQLERIRHLPVDKRVEPLERLFVPDDPLTVRAGVLLAEALYEQSEHERAIALYETLLACPEPSARDSIRLGHIRALHAAGQAQRIVDLVQPTESSATVRGYLGLALLHLGASEPAVPHLTDAWAELGARSPELALAYARVCWKQGQYHAAAEPYRYFIERAQDNLQATDHTATDFAAIAELAHCGEIEDLPDDRVLDSIEAFCARASALERASDDAHQLVQYGLELARRVNDGSRLANAYRHLIDDALQRRDGPGLVALMAHVALDYRQYFLSANQRFDLLDEIGDNLLDYRLLLRQPLIEGYEELLRDVLDAAGSSESPLPPESRDIYRSLYDLDRRNAVCDRYRQILASKPSLPELRAGDGVPKGISGKRIALVGGHDSTRMRVKEHLRVWGARVDEVPPPTNGRISEREVLDRVRMSDLVLLIVSYMGHDMSTIVNNLAARKALCGQVLAVECRGTSGVLRVITQWAEAV
ncbi:MAG: repeat-containing protein [Chloroflexi bacterium]|nr:repeat-containing protein [Chloroflexota bacterium]